VVAESGVGRNRRRISRPSAKAVLIMDTVVAIEAVAVDAVDSEVEATVEMVVDVADTVEVMQSLKQWLIKYGIRHLIWGSSVTVYQQSLACIWHLNAEVKRNSVVISWDISNCFAALHTLFWAVQESPWHNLH